MIRRAGVSFDPAERQIMRLMTTTNLPDAAPLSSPQNISRKLEPFAQRVFHVFGKETIQRVGLMPRQLRQAKDRTVAAWQAQNALDHAQQPTVDFQPIWSRTFTVPANHRALCWGKISG